MLSCHFLCSEARLPLFFDRVVDSFRVFTEIISSIIAGYVSSSWIDCGAAPYNSAVINERLSLLIGNSLPSRNGQTNLLLYLREGCHLPKNPSLQAESNLLLLSGQFNEKESKKKVLTTLGCDKEIEVSLIRDKR